MVVVELKTKRIQAPVEVVRVGVTIILELALIVSGVAAVMAAVAVLLLSPKHQQQQQ